MAQAAQSRGFFSFLTDKKVTYHRAVGKERKERKAEALADRKERLALSELRAKEKAAEAKIAAAERKIEQARDTIKTAEKKESKGGMTEAKLEQIKAHMQREIEAQQRHKALAQGKNPAVSAKQYRLAQAVLSGTARSSMPRKVAQEIVDRTPAKLRSQYMKGNPATDTAFGGTTPFKGGYKNGYIIGQRPDRDQSAELQREVDILKTHWNASAKQIEQYRSGYWKGYSAGHKKNPTGGTKARKPCGQKNRGSSKKRKRNPAVDADKLSEKFHGRPATPPRRVVEQLHVHKHLMEIGDLVRLVVDTPTGKVVVLNFNTSDPRKIVRLATSERDPKTNKLVGKQLYLRGGDQEVNLKALGMDSPLWIRDLMELGRFHRFKKGDPPLIVDGKRVKGSITYRTRKGMDDFKLVDYWHKAGEETERTLGDAARSLVLYDYPNKKIMFGGGNYRIEAPGIIN